DRLDHVLGIDPPGQRQARTDNHRLTRRKTIGDVVAALDRRPLPLDLADNTVCIDALPIEGVGTGFGLPGKSLAFREEWGVVPAFLCSPMAAKKNGAQA